MKKFFKKYIIPAQLWQDLRLLKKWKYRKRNDWKKVNNIKTLTTFFKILFKGRVRVYEPLDYSSGNILLNITSTSEFPRTGACKKEPETIEWIERCVKPGDVFYDIGANVGAYSFVAHAVTGGRCSIYAFEPSFSTFSSLCKNIIINNFNDTIVPLHIALSHKTEIIPFYYSDIAPGAAQHNIMSPDTNKSLVSNTEIIQKMPSYRLDDLIEVFTLPIPNHVKIDVDGAEYKILQGAKKTLSKSDVRSLLIEIDESLDPENKIQRLIKECGFSLSSKHSRMKSDILFNYIFEKKSR